MTINDGRSQTSVNHLHGWNSSVLLPQVHLWGNLEKFFWLSEAAQAPDETTGRQDEEAEEQRWLRERKEREERRQREQEEARERELQELKRLEEEMVRIIFSTASFWPSQQHEYWHL